MVIAGVVGLLAGTAQAGSAVKWGDFSASGGDRLTGASLEAGNQYVLKASSISVGDIEQLQAAQKRTESEVQGLKGKLEGQDRAFDEFKRRAIESGLQLFVTRVSDEQFQVKTSH
jgi:hypothetical protein